MSVHVKQLSSWPEFKEFTHGFAGASRRYHDVFAFRGQADSRWSLQTTLDRAFPGLSSEGRKRCREALRSEFRRLALGVGEDLSRIESETDWELLGRHHGLPSPILDWTSSPYVAAYFAFCDEPGETPETCAVWMLNRTVFLDSPERARAKAAVEMIDDVDAVQCIHRAIEQRASFLRVESVEQPLEQLFDDYLHRFEIPWTERGIALADLDQSLINARSLFRDLDGAARTAGLRVLR